ncbi:peptide deformylase [Flavobacteriaceae bacterium Ap0902]|nr:peptide deformylase [Flavobacteriaceae bacterium Ap0902]
MILPVRAYGDNVLRTKGKEIDKNYPHLQELIDDMFETMEASHGVGIAAPQIGLPIRLFIVDVTPFAEDEEYEAEAETLKNFRKVFINAEKLDEEGEEWKFNEGCLSIPGIREDVSRKETITLRYMDRDFNEFTETFTGIAARVIQHEYDHIEGILFTDYLSAFKKRLLKKKLNNIRTGNVHVDYKMRFPKK